MLPAPCWPFAHAGRAAASRLSALAVRRHGWQSIASVSAPPRVLGSALLPGAAAEHVWRQP